jgi:hypothetical protein
MPGKLRQEILVFIIIQASEMKARVHVSGSVQQPTQNPASHNLSECQLIGAKEVEN